MNDSGSQCSPNHPVGRPIRRSLRQFGQRERERLLAVLNALLLREGNVPVFAYALRKLAQV